jgi:hypothetical protein
MKNFNKALLAIGVVGLGSVISAPAFAQSYASGSSTIVLMNGASQSVGVEISAPSGANFQGTTNEIDGNGSNLGGSIGFTASTAGTPTGVAVASPLLGSIDGALNTFGNDLIRGDLSTNQTIMSSLVLDAGPASVSPTAVSTSFTAAAAKALESYGFDLTTGLVLLTRDLSAQVSIIRAGAGVDGLE